MRDSAPRYLPLLSVLALALALAACQGSSTSTSSASTVSPSSTAALTTETFTGSFGQNGSAIFPFTVANTGYSLLAGFTSLSPSSVTALGLGIGQWDATTSTCGLNMSQSDAAHSGSTAVSGTANAGSYCVRLYDAGNIGQGVTASFTVQVQHY
jgi:hypothetical protein